jgi:hypothetical protein
MAGKAPWSLLSQRWLHIQLPGYRESPQHHTYQGTPLEDLPPIPVELDENCDWLMREGTVHAEDGLHRYERDIQPGYVERLAQESHLKLPGSFARFMSLPELQSRVRSCTDCYLDPGERIVQTIGAIPGNLVHFLSDSQSCAHWYLHVLPNGDAAVLESEDLYCYKIENSDWIENPACRLERIDVSGLNFAYCAPSFSDFLYRFWIENEIWYALMQDGTTRRLKPLELKYLSHYSKKARA